MTMDAIAHHIRLTTGQQISARTATRYAHIIGKSFKKAFRLVDYKHDKFTVRKFCSSFLSSKRIVSIDESCFYVGDHPRKGWCTRGRKLSISCSKTVRRTKFTLLMAVTEDGIIHHEILDHNCKKTDFISFFKNIPFQSADTVVMDNISFHHSKEIIEWASLKSVSVLHTPPYSPRCNPIEKVFGFLKPRYRKACQESNNNFDKTVCLQTFEGVLATTRNRKLHSTFESTRKFVCETISSIDTDPSFVFMGYDK